MEQAEYALMDAAEGGMWWYRALHARLLDSVQGINGRILDAGCGTGGFLACLRLQHPRLGAFGVERFPAAAQRARAKSAARVVVGDLNKLPYGDSCFDAAVMADVLCHAAVDPPAALAEIRRVLRPGGRIVMNMPAYAWLFSAHDRRVHNVRRQTAGEVRGMLWCAGFEQVQARYWNSLLLPAMILTRKFRLRRDSGSNTGPFPPWLNAVLYQITETERRLALALPAGGSVLAQAIRPG
ncbi:MAG: class I SAM-dependent methyltransferase [Acetobacteraceae bacterium]|nr:class I SAM-dependent methyltransferase [Acetobacteraceae bacterium]MBV8524843.1 class I SAM-dependent methyltransferase [Acetobacteraceae bacterium]MBV8590348.1 class I SAM-dependent methyltransferase [Acetobacteraceae bacterium]